MDGRLEQLDRIDLVGSGPQVAIGPVDPVPLVLAATRASMCDELVDEAIEAVAHDMLKLCPRTDLRRYGLEPQEQQAATALAQEPVGFDQLLERALVPPPVLRRLVYVLLLTRAVTLVPAFRRISSGAIAHEQQLPTARPPARQDEPTAVVSLQPLARQPATETRSVRPVRPTYLEYRDSAAPRARYERPVGSGPPPADAYHVRNPDNGTLSVPPLRASASPSGVSYSSVPAPDDPAAAVDADMHFRAAEVLLQRGDCRRAVLAAQKAMKLAPPRPEQRALYAWLLYQRSGGAAEVPPHVWDHLERALDADPDCAPAHRYMGALLGRTGQVEQARDHFQRALQLDSSDSHSERELALLEHEP
jgi:tetratricopeptide (TPR) repeat protein